MKYSIWNKWECGAGTRWTTPNGGIDHEGTTCSFSGCNCNTLVKGMGQTCNVGEAREWLRKPSQSVTSDKPSSVPVVKPTLEIFPKYKRLVECVKIACESLRWDFNAKQEEDDLLILTLDKCKYCVSRSGPHGEKHYVSAVVTLPATQHEPETEDEMVIHETNCNPEGLLSYLIDAHFKEVRKVWAIQATYDPIEEKEYEESLEQA